jgi:hypothetical protein
MFGLSLPDLLKVVPAVLIGLTVHELAHAAAHGQAHAEPSEAH